MRYKLVFEFGIKKSDRCFDLEFINFANKKDKLQNNSNKVLGNSFNKLLIL